MYTVSHRKIPSYTPTPKNVESVESVERFTHIPPLGRDLVGILKVMTRNERRYSLKQMRKRFPNDGAILDALFEAQHDWTCNCGGVYKYHGNRRYQCNRCRFKVSPAAGTIFHKSTTSLTDWMQAIYLFAMAKSGMSAKELQHILGCAYKTAWRTLYLIRIHLPLSSDALKHKTDIVVI